MHRQVPDYRITTFVPKQFDYCVAIPVLNEGERFINQLRRMRAVPINADLVVADGGSRDGSVLPESLAALGVRTLLTKEGPGKLSAQMRMAFDYGLNEDYQGMVMLDGNGKDGVEAIPDFIAALTCGYDYIQGSRYLPGGKEENTPLDRRIGGRFVHAPILSLASGFHYTDTTNGFRGFSARFLSDPRLALFRDIFDTYNLHYYMSLKAPRLGFRVIELPVARRYPPSGRTPSKINGFRAKLGILQLLLSTIAGKFDPPSSQATRLDDSTLH